ncbi:MAG: PAS domain S-box protein, partial [Candidatus Thorarchaeota archaeon]|nr:PAS domain S-box protein [Candidatus Thorarchaeota archaeon]
MQVRVLVIDDDEDILFLANRYLSSGESDILIVPVSNAQDALQEVESGNIDAIICDFHLGPGEMNGLELLEWVRGQRLDIPFIIFTGRSREEVAIQALNLGADYYLEKGDDFEGLFTEIAHHIKNTVRSRKTEEALVESEQKYRTLVQSISDLIFVLDAKDCFSQYHSPFKSDLLMQPDDFMYRHVADILPAEIANQYLEHSKSVRTTGERKQFEYSIEMGNQEEWYEATLDLHEDTESIVVTVTNISERKRSDIALKESEARKDSILRVAPVGIGVVVNRVFQFVSQTLLDITGYTNEDLIGKNTRMLYPSQEEFDKVGSEKYRDIRESGTGSIETKFVRKDGIIIDVDLRSTPVVKGDLEGAVTFTAHDITDRKRIERELIEADKRWVNT